MDEQTQDQVTEQAQDQVVEIDETFESFKIYMKTYSTRLLGSYLAKYLKASDLKYVEAINKEIELRKLK